MAKKSIQSRYSIDYVYPDDSSKGHSTKKKSYTTIILSIITLGLIASFVLPLNIKEFIHNMTKTSEKTPSTVDVENKITNITTKKDIATEVANVTEKIIPNKEISTPAVEKSEPIQIAVIKKEIPVQKIIEPVMPKPIKSIPAETSVEKVEPVKVTKIAKVDTPTKVEVLTPESTTKKAAINNEQLATSLKQLTINAELNRKLAELSKQLIAEQKKTEALSTRLKIRKNRNNALSGMLKNALDKASDADKRYVSALNGQTKEAKKKKTKINLKRARNDVAKRITLNTKQVDYNNSFTVTSTKQIDAILVAMQASSTSKPLAEIEPINTGSTIVQIPTSSTSSSQPVYASLQDQINQLISIDNKDDDFNNVFSDNPNSDLESEYKKALNIESDVRSNEMRSIVIIKGDTLWAIAKRAYGSGAEYKKIITANPNIVKNGKVLLLVGQVIRVPI